MWDHLDLESDIESGRLLLTPLRREHADRLFALLNDKVLHRFIGGAPLSLDELRARYASLAGRHSPDRSELWLNWIVIRRADHAAVGTMQATVSDSRASLAWVIGRRWQGHGYASEAARSLVDWLFECARVNEVRAHIHPYHVVSARVARGAGLAPIDEFAEGERVWRLGAADYRAQPSTRGGS